jgi:hypothetical protein
MSMMPRILPHEAERIKKMHLANELAFEINLAAFNSTRASIVSETEFSSGNIVRITEKTIKPFCVGHPTLVAGNPRSLEFVRQIGFETFSSTFDESYDQIMNPVDRLFALTESALELRSLLSAKASPTHGRLRDICRYNRHHAEGRALATYEATVERTLTEQLVAFFHSNANPARTVKT